MSSTPVDVGTLIVVILKAKNLPNKRHIGKQDPYCSLKLNNETRRTKAVKRGGQHPEWDEEVRFTILEDVEDELARTAGGNGTDDSPPPPPPKKEKEKKKIRGPKQMQLMCYADDPREPALIGETMVDLTEVLTKGETDEWFTLTNKEKYCGEVYLELTFWSNEKPPEKRSTPPSSTFHPQYGGPGSFTPSPDLPASLKHGGGTHQNTPSPSRHASSSGTDPLLPPSLRPSGSLAQINLYTAPYERRNRYSEVENLSTDLADFSVSGSSRRRESFPPVQVDPSEFGYVGGNVRQNGSFSTMSSSASLSSVHSHGPPISGSRHPQGHHRYSLSSLPEPFVQDEYVSGLPQSLQPASEGYIPTSSYQYQQQPSGFIQPPPLHQTPAPVPSQFGVPSVTPPTMPSPFGVPSVTPPAMPSPFVPPPPSSSPMSFHPPPQQQYNTPQQTPFQYPVYPQPPLSAPVVQYVPQEAPLPSASVPPNALPAPQQYGQHPTHSPPHQHQQAHPPPNAYQQLQPGVPPPQGSRPLPNPQTHYQPRPDNQPSSGFTSPPPGPPSSMGPGNITFPNTMPFQPPGPPPPPPPRRRTSLPPSPTKTPSVTNPPPPPPLLQNGAYPQQVTHVNTPPPPPPPPLALYQNNSPSPSPHGSQLPQSYPPQQSQQPQQSYHPQQPPQQSYPPQQPPQQSYPPQQPPQQSYPPQQPPPQQSYPLQQPPQQSYPPQQPPQQSYPPQQPQQSYPPQQPQQSYPPQQSQQSYPPQQSQGFGSWAPPPPPPTLSGFSSPPHPSTISTPPPHQPYYSNGPSAAPGWNTPPRQNPQQQHLEGWHQ